MMFMKTLIKRQKGKQTRKKGQGTLCKGQGVTEEGQGAIQIWQGVALCYFAINETLTSGVAFIKYNYIENAESSITPTKIVKSK